MPDLYLTQNAGEIVEEAFKKIGVKGAEQPLTSFEQQDGMINLNLMMQAWQAQGMHLWTMQEAVLPLEKFKQRYLLGEQGDHFFNRYDFFAGLLTTNINIPAVVENMEISFGVELSQLQGGVFNTTFFTTNEGEDPLFLGIETADQNSRIWFTPVTYLVNDSTYTYTATLDDVGKSFDFRQGASIYIYRTKPARPLRITSFRRRTFEESTEIEVRPWSRQEYFDQINKESEGVVIKCYYSPQLNNGELFVWLSPIDARRFVTFTYERPLLVVNNPIDTVDFPVEWNEVLVWNLAARLAHDYNKDMSEVDRISVIADRMLQNLLRWDQAITPTYIHPTNKQRN